MKQTIVACAALAIGTITSLADDFVLVLGNGTVHTETVLVQ